MCLLAPSHVVTNIEAVINKNQRRKENHMTTQAASFGETRPISWASARPYVALAGRGLFSLIFILAALGHFSKQTIEFAASHGVPLASLAVPLSGLLSLAGGLSVLLGYRAKVGAWLLVLFLVPVTLAMHPFWAVHDPMMAQMQQAMFMKNLSMLGGALFISQVGAGPLSLDARRGK
jgi:putative oxidoreductase